MNPSKILPPPVAMQFLPKDHRGYVVPFFVEWVDGKPDFRVIDGRKLRRCVHEKLCWLCGGPLNSRTVAYVVGPMCALNRTSSEPPSHVECAEYAAKVCPFLTMPKAQRREANMPAGHVEAPGVGLKRNPGATLVWVTRDRLKPFSVPRGPNGERAGTLFDIGSPIKTLWFAEGRPALRAEVLASIESGLPLLLEVAKTDRDGALAELERRRLDAMQYLPAEAA
jgi:hypothetical protein